jgi:hypothetical protein
VAVCCCQLNWSCRCPSGSALARFEPGMSLVDDIDAPFAAHDATVLVALFQRLQRIDDLHARTPWQGPEDRDRVRAKSNPASGSPVCAWKAASAADGHECSLLIQTRRGPIYQHPPIWTLPMSPATPQPSWKTLKSWRYAEGSRSGRGSQAAHDQVLLIGYFRISRRLRP